MWQSGLICLRFQEICKLMDTMSVSNHVAVGLPHHVYELCMIMAVQWDVL